MVVRVTFSLGMTGGTCLLFPFLRHLWDLTWTTAAWFLPSQTGLCVREDITLQALGRATFYLLFNSSIPDDIKLLHVTVWAENRHGCFCLLVFLFCVWTDIVANWKHETYCDVLHCVCDLLCMFSFPVSDIIPTNCMVSSSCGRRDWLLGHNMYGTFGGLDTGSSWDSCDLTNYIYGQLLLLAFKQALSY